MVRMRGMALLLCIALLACAPAVVAEDGVELVIPEANLKLLLPANCAVLTRETGPENIRQELINTDCLLFLRPKEVPGPIFRLQVDIRPFSPLSHWLQAWELPEILETKDKIVADLGSLGKMVDVEAKFTVIEAHKSPHAEFLHTVVEGGHEGRVLQQHSYCAKLDGRYVQLNILGFEDDLGEDAMKVIIAIVDGMQLDKSSMQAFDIPELGMKVKVNGNLKARKRDQADPKTLQFMVHNNIHLLGITSDNSLQFYLWQYEEIDDEWESRLSQARVFSGEIKEMWLKYMNSKRKDWQYTDYAVHDAATAFEIQEMVDYVNGQEMGSLLYIAQHGKIAFEIKVLSSDGAMTAEGRMLARDMVDSIEFIAQSE